MQQKHEEQPPHEYIEQKAESDRTFQDSQPPKGGLRVHRVHGQLHDRLPRQ